MTPPHLNRARRAPPAAPTSGTESHDRIDSGQERSSDAECLQERWCPSVDVDASSGPPAIQPQPYEDEDRAPLLLLLTLLPLNRLRGASSNPGVLLIQTPLLTNDNTPWVSGRSNLDAGTALRLVVVDGRSGRQAWEVVASPGGGLQSEVPIPLADGPFSVVVTATDAQGNPVIASAAGVVDTTPPVLTLTLQLQGLQAAADGTTDLGPGAVVQMIFMDASGTRSVVLVPTASDGSFTALAPTVLSEGLVTVVATVHDAAGNVASAVAVGTIDVTAPDIIISAPALTNKDRPLVTGTTDLPAGSTIWLEFSDTSDLAQGVTARVALDGSFSVQPPSVLKEGGYTVLASVADAAGNPAHALADGKVDLTPPVIRIDLPDLPDLPVLTHDPTPMITGLTDLPPDASVILVIFDEAGRSQALLGDVGADQLFAVDSPHLPDGNYTVVAVAVDTAGNTASASGRITVDTKAPLASISSLSVSDDNTLNLAESQSSGVSVSGRVVGEFRADDGVSLLIGSTTYTAVLRSDGSFVTTVPGAELLGDAEAEAVIEAVVHASDAAGNVADSAPLQAPFAVDVIPPFIKMDPWPSFFSTGTPLLSGTTMTDVTEVTLRVQDAADRWSDHVAIVDAFGHFSFAPTLSPGGFTVWAQAVDRAHNVGTTTIPATGAYSPPLAISTVGGYGPLSTVAENTTDYRVQFQTTGGAGDLVWDLSAGPDKSQFYIDPDTGLLTFTGNRGLLDYDLAGDADGDNVYAVTVRARDPFGNTAEQQVTLTLTDIPGPDITLAPVWLWDAGNDLTLYWESMQDIVGMLPADHLTWDDDRMLASNAWIHGTFTPGVFTPVQASSWPDHWVGGAIPAADTGGIDSWYLIYTVFITGDTDFGSGAAIYVRLNVDHPLYRQIGDGMQRTDVVHLWLRDDRTGELTHLQSPWRATGIEDAPELNAAGGVVTHASSDPSAPLDLAYTGLVSTVGAFDWDGNLAGLQLTSITEGTLLVNGQAYVAGAASLPVLGGIDVVQWIPSGTAVSLTAPVEAFRVRAVDAAGLTSWDEAPVRVEWSGDAVPAIASIADLHTPHTWGWPSGQVVTPPPLL